MKKQPDRVDPGSLVRPGVRNASAYHVDQFPCEVVLDANESPYPPPAKIRERLWVVMAGTAFNRYPDMETSLLRNAIASKEGVDAAETMPGNGSDEIVQSLVIALGEPGARILTPSPTFSMYRAIAAFHGVDTIEAPLNEDWTLDTETTIRLASDQSPSIVFLASPNNPTGVRYDRADVESIADACGGVVVVDEAYVDFSSEPVGAMFRDRPNVVILKTLSKIGLAALRLGYMMADRRLIEQVNKVRLPFNINSVTQAVVVEALKYWEAFTPLFREITRERERVFKGLESITGVDPFPSEANFILMRISSDPALVFDSLIRKSVRVRWFKGADRVGDCFRVTIGSPAENDRFLTALRQSL